MKRDKQEQQGESKYKREGKDDIDLVNQNFSFIHLTFQEYLSASYIKKAIENTGT